MDNRLHVVTSFFVPHGAERLPCHIDAAFREHLANQWVESITVLTEADADLVRLLCEALGNADRLEVVACSARPTFAELFAVASRQIVSRGGLAAVMNADISFADDAAIHRCIGSLLESSRINPSCVYALTRYDCDSAVWGLYLHEEHGGPNFLSADCWAFAHPIELAAGAGYSLGQMNCDLMVNYDLIAAGHCLFNPCLDIRIHHHEAELKELAYYVEESRKEDSQKRLWQFVSSRGIPGYDLYGVPWIHAEWLARGYRPLPYAIRARKIFIALPDDEPARLLPMICGIDIYACRYDFDIVLISASTQKLQSFLPVARKNRRMYFIELRHGFRGFADSLLQNGYNDSPSVALASDTRFLTDNLARLTKVIVLDLRNVGGKGETPAIPAISGCDPESFGNRHPGLDHSGIFLSEGDAPHPRKCTLITSVFQSGKFLPSFLRNSRELDGYHNEIDHLFLVSKNTADERSCLLDHVAAHSNTMVIWHRSDPGLYECWNAGIRLAQTELVSNANVDDLRAPSHVRELVTILENRPDVSVAATAIVPFEDYTGHLNGIDVSSPWYADRAGHFGFTDLFGLLADDEGGLRMDPHCMPHCMPVWRRSLHDSHGFFDERRYGTFADWEFWLRVTKAGASGYLHPEPLSFYFVNPGSHNRRGSELPDLHSRVTGEYLPHAVHRAAGPNGVSCSGSGRPLQRKLNLVGRNAFYGVHRNSFNSIVDCLEPLHLGAEGIDFMPFIERYFVWGTDPGEAKSQDPQPLSRPWIGILHVPFDGPAWSEGQMRPEVFFQTELWKRSLEHCRGLICLSEDLELDLKSFYPDLPTLALRHPTGPSTRSFDFKAYAARPRLVQVGDWLRKLQSIYRIRPCRHEKIILLKQYTRHFMELEIAAVGDFRDDSVRELDFVSNEEYDEILSSSVVLCLLYATAANNVVLECIARATPIIINPLPSVVEYLGVDYPLYATTFEEAEVHLMNREMVKSAHDALVRRRAALDLSYAGFMHALASSEFYSNL